MDVLRSILCGHGACEDGVERKVKMKAADLRQRFARGVNQKLRFGLYASVAAASFLVARAWAGPESAVGGNEPKKEKSQEDIEEQGKEGEMKQGEQQGQATQAAGQPAEKPEDTRTVYFEYDMATWKVTRLDNFEAAKKKPMWAAVSPDGKAVVFARGFNLYQVDGENYAKALKKAGDASVVETQVTTDGV